MVVEKLDDVRNKSYNNLTLEKLNEIIEEVFGTTETSNLLGISKINDNCYQIKIDNGVLLTGKKGVIDYIKTFDKELKEYINNI